MAAPRHDYSILVELSDDGHGFVARVPDLPGCVSEGDTAEEALANIQEAIAARTAEARAAERPMPMPTRSRITAKWTSE